MTYIGGQKGPFTMLNIFVAAIGGMLAGLIFWSAYCIVRGWLDTRRERREAREERARWVRMYGEGSSMLQRYDAEHAH
jgi:hypothetical protein